MTKSRDIRLRSHAVGLPSHDNFELVEVELPPLGPGEIQVRNQWLSIDPVAHIRMSGMSGANSVIPPFAIGRVLDGGAIGEVIASRDPDFATGQLVQSWFGWREAYNAQATVVQKLAPGGLPPQAFLGAAGATGLMAYVGLAVAEAQAGEVIFVSSAAGAVGSMVCQFAKAKGLTVIGSAGGALKTAYLKEIGVDEAIDYKAEGSLAAALKAAAPRGIDIYFDNVGGDHLEAAIEATRPGARIILCGAIAASPSGPRNLVHMIAKQVRMQGVTVLAHLDKMPSFQNDLRRWVAEGKVSWRETVLEGIERAPEALLGLLKGAGIGKTLVKLV